MIYRQSCSYLCMKWEVPDVIRILKELNSCYIIEDINYHFVYVKVIFICLFIIILQTISYQISSSTLILIRNDQSTSAVNAYADNWLRYIDTHDAEAIYVRTREDRFGKRRTKFLSRHVHPSQFTLGIGADSLLSNSGRNGCVYWDVKCESIECTLFDFYI